MNLDLTGGLLATALVVASLVLPVLSLGLWSRVRGPQLLAQGQRWCLVVSSQVIAVVAVLVLINDYFGLYSTWDDLLGRPSSETVAGVLDPTPVGTSAHAGQGSPHPSSTDGAPVLATQVPWSAGLPAGFAAYTERTECFVPPARIERATHGLGNRCSIP